MAVAGISATALRLPSVLAMAVAAVFTAAIGRRLARAARLLLAAHGVTVWIAHTRQRDGRGRAAAVTPSPLPVSRWLTAAGPPSWC
jgi:hypothetical protein